MGIAAPESSGQRVARLRIQAGLSARQLAEKAGVSHSCVNQVERGRAVTREVLAKLEVILGPLDFLPLWPALPAGTTPLAQARRVTRESPREAAERAGVSDDVFVRAERGGRVRPAHAKRIADAFGLDASDVLPVPHREASNRRAA